MHAYKKALILFLSMVLLVTSCSNKNKEKDKEIDRLNQLIERQGQKTEEPKTEELSELKLDMEKEREKYNEELEAMKLDTESDEEHLKKMKSDLAKWREGENSNEMKELKGRFEEQERQLNECKKWSKRVSEVWHAVVLPYKYKFDKSPLDEKCSFEEQPGIFAILCEDANTNPIYTLNVDDFNCEDWDEKNLNVFEEFYKKREESFKELFKERDENGNDELVLF